MANMNEDVGDEVVEITGLPRKDIWPRNIESCFIGLMEEEVKKGNRQTTTLTRDAWRRIKEELKKQFDKEHTNDQIKNKFNQLSGKWKDFNNLLKLETGLGYNSTTGQLNASNDKWKKLCEYKFTKQFKKRGCLHYDKLCVIYGDTTASGANQHLSTKSPSVSNDDESEEDFDDDEDCQQSKKKKKVSKDTKKRNARENAQVAFANAMTIFGEHTKKKMERMDKSQEVVMDVMNTSSLDDSNDDSDEEFLTIVGLYVSMEYNGLLNSTSRPQRLSRLKGHEWERDKLNDTWFLSVQEQVAMFLLIICRTVRTRFSGAIDGTHISACIPKDQQIPYRGRKLDPTINVMCCCSFDMKFTFVMVGWEGTGNDSRIFFETIYKAENGFPISLTGKYYVVDSGYANMPELLSPYRGERYHLRDYRGQRAPQGPKELFNYMHSSLRNVIERCFGVLKARFPILKSMLPYALKRQKYIRFACCVLHSFIKMEQQGDPLFAQYADENVVLEEEAPNENNNTEEHVPPQVTNGDFRQMAAFRD